MSVEWRTDFANPGAGHHLGLRCPGMTDPAVGDGGQDYDAALPGAPTELAPSADETEAHTAWALDDGPEWKPPFWTAGRITAAAVGIAVLAAVVVAGLVGYHLRSTPEMVSAPLTSSAAAKTTAAPVTTPPVRADDRKGWGLPAGAAPPVTKTVAAPPKTVTVQAPPPVYVPPPVVDMTAFDGQFIGNLRAQGWVIWNEQQSASSARLACSMLHNGAPFEYVANHLATQSQAKIEEGRVFTSTAMRTYPNCP